MENLYLVIGTNSKVVLASMVLEFVLTLLLLLNILVSLIHTCSILHCVKCVRIRSYSVFSPNAGKWGKIWTRIFPNTDTFYAALIKDLVANSLES